VFLWRIIKMKIHEIFIKLFFLWKLDFMSQDSWHESRLIFMKIHFMSIFRIDLRVDPLKTKRGSILALITINAKTCFFIHSSYTKMSYLLRTYAFEVSFSDFFVIWGRLNQHFTQSFYVQRSPKCTNLVKSSVSCTFGICAHKSLL